MLALRGGGRRFCSGDGGGIAYGINELKRGRNQNVRHCPMEGMWLRIGFSLVLPSCGPMAGSKTVVSERRGSWAVSVLMHSGGASLAKAYLALR